MADNNSNRLIIDTLDAFELSIYRDIIEASDKNEVIDINQVISNYGKHINHYRLHYLNKRLSNEKLLKELYKDSLLSYKKILTNYKTLANELDISSSLHLSQFLSILLWCGFFSINKKHTYTLRDRYFLDGLYSFDVFNGGGVCTSYSQLLEDYLREFGFETASLGCKSKLKFESSKFRYMPPITRNYDISGFESLIESIIPNFLSILAKNKCTHAFTLIEDIQGMYIFDITNLSAFNITSSTNANGVAYNHSYKVYPDISTLCFGSVESVDLIEKLFCISSKDDNHYTRSITPYEFINSYERIIVKFVNNIGLIHDAYDESINDITTIHNEMKKYGKCSKSLRYCKSNHIYK